MEFNNRVPGRVLYVIAWGFNFLLNSSGFLHKVFTKFSDKQFLLKLIECSRNLVNHLHKILQNFLVVVEQLFFEIVFLLFNACAWNHLVVRNGEDAASAGVVWSSTLKFTGRISTTLELAPVLPCLSKYGLTPQKHICVRTKGRQNFSLQLSA